MYFCYTGGRPVIHYDDRPPDPHPRIEVERLDVTSRLAAVQRAFPDQVQLIQLTRRLSQERLLHHSAGCSLAARADQALLLAVPSPLLTSVRGVGAERVGFDCEDARPRPPGRAVIVVVHGCTATRSPSS